MGFGNSHSFQGQRFFLCRVPRWACGSGLGYWALSALLVVSLACSQGPARPEVYPVTGKVTFQGEPTTGAFLVFHPLGQAAAGEQNPTATVTPDGTFKVTSHGEAANSDGAPAGDYAVTVEWFKPVKKGADFERGPNVIPAAYGKPDSTPLKVKVEAKPNELPPFEIKK